ncbi:MAG: DUF3619 family protein [Gallionella sp.]|nr:DUF3619 family protein [Gallionella sp.]
MTTKLDPQKIIQVLELSSQNLDQKTLASLQQARAKALQRQAGKAHVLQLADHRWSTLLVPHSLQQWAIAVLLVLAVFAGGGMWWQHSQLHHIELDEQILTDELPIEIFID